MRKFLNWIKSWFVDIVPDASQLRTNAQEMLKGVNMLGDSASHAMVLADESHDALQKELENFEALGRQAKEFLKETDTEAAEQCVALQMQSETKIKTLAEAYKAYQATAETKVTRFQKKRKEVDEKIEALPELEEQIQVNEVEVQIAKQLSTLDMDSAESDYNRIARKIRVTNKQLQNKAVLETDPKAHINQRIKDTLAEKELQTRMVELQKEIDSDEGIIDGEIVEATPATEEAQLLLETARYPNELNLKKESREKVPVRIKEKKEANTAQTAKQA